jgi:exonuclease SbcC
MRVLAIRGKDLTSLAGEFAVDFEAEPLASAGIFAITGPTGAGKSTLLDAVCLALFNHVPRLASAASGQIGTSGSEMISASDPRALLRHRASDGYAEVDFIGLDRGRYRARWSVRRARGRGDGALQNVVQTFTNLDTGVALGGTRTETLAEIRTKVGLSAQQFGRAVMLAQGDFNAFIDADSNTRAELLEKLTGTELYAHLGMAARRKADMLRQALADIETRIAAQNGLDDIARAEAEERLTITRAEHERTRADVAARKGDRNWYGRADELAKLVDAADRNRAAAEERSRDAEPRRAALAQRRIAHSIVPAWRAAAETDARAADLVTRIAALGKAADAARASATAASARHEENTGALVRAEAERERHKPEIEEARALDRRITEVTGSLTSLVERRATAASQAADSGALYADAVKGRDEAASRRDLLTRWTEDHRSRENLAARHNDLSADIEERATLVEKARGIEQQRRSIGERITVARVNCDKAETASSLAKTTFEMSQVRAKEAAAAVAAADDITSAEQARDRLVAIEPCLLSYERAFADLDRLELAVGTAREEKSSLEVALTSSETRRGEIDTTLPVLQARHEETSRAAALSAAASDDAAERLRMTLLDGEPCPVCGGRDHAVEALAGLIDGRATTDAARVREIGSEIDALNRERAVLVDRFDTANLRLTTLHADLADKQIAISSASDARNASFGLLETALDACGIPHNLDASALRVDIAARVDAIDSQRRSYREKQDAARRTTQALDEARTELDSSAQTERATTQALRDLESEDTRLTERLADTIKRRDQLGSELEASLSPHFDWREDRAPIATLAQRVEEWRAQAQALAAVNAQLPVLTNATHEADVVRGRDAERLQAAQRNEQAAIQERDRLASERASKLSGESVMTVSERLEVAVQAASRRTEEARVALEAARAEVTACETRHEQASGNLAAERAEATARRDTLQAELAAKGIDGASMPEVAAEDIAVLDHEARSLAELDRAIVAVTAELRSRIADREAHAATEAPMLGAEELGAALAETIAAEAKARESLTEAELVIRQDDRAREATSALRQTLEQDRASAMPWLQLDVLIGDSTGNKFRRYAQGLTLERLLLHANVRLAELKPRYSLERVPGGEMLVQVIDNDMAGEIRGLANLSGGERFLVSLALALGLSEMSTGQGMRVESLFIDEGFGSLDSASLGQAIGVLEQLHATGRRVGVISHIEDVKDRIGVKIAVSPESNGRSVIEIHGG